MWSKASREHLAKIERQTKRYPSDLTDAEWLAMAQLMPGAARTGRRWRVDFREILNAIRYMVRSGCEWRMLPVHFPPWQTVYWWFRRFVRLFLFCTIHDVALMIDRARNGRVRPSSSATLFTVFFAQIERNVWPIQLGFMDNARVLAGWCELRSDFRFFRTDRILSTECLGRYSALRTRQDSY